MSELQVQVVTPEAVKYTGTAKRVQLPGVMGEMGVLPQHSPLVSMLNPGKVEVVAAEGTKVFAVAEGFATIANNQVVCLVDAAVEASEVDVTKANQRVSDIEAELAKAENALLRGELAYLKAQLSIKA